jgi:hypothetical protein
MSPPRLIHQRNLGFVMISAHGLICERQASLAVARLDQKDRQTEDLPMVTIVSPSAQAGVAGAGDRVGTVADLQLGEDVAHVIAHCFG